MATSKDFEKLFDNEAEQVSVLDMDMAGLETGNYDDDLDNLLRYANVMQKEDKDSNEYNYKLIADCNQLSVDIDNEIVNIHNFIRDMYRLKFPELDSLVPHPIDYARVVKEIGNQTDLTLVDLQGLLPSAIAMAVSVTALTTKGNPLPEDVLQRTIDACDRALDLDSARKKVVGFLESKM